MKHSLNLNNVKGLSLSEINNITTSYDIDRTINGTIKTHKGLFTRKVSTQICSIALCLRGDHVTINNISDLSYSTSINNLMGFDCLTKRKGNKTSIAGRELQSRNKGGMNNIKRLESYIYNCKDITFKDNDLIFNKKITDKRDELIKTREIAQAKRAKRSLQFNAFNRLKEKYKLIKTRDRVNKPLSKFKKSISDMLYLQDRKSVV